METKNERSIFELVGREAGCRKLATEFYSRVAKSDVLKPLFPGKSLRCATEEFSAFLIQFFDGDPEQTQYRWWLSLRESHARFKISDAQRDEWFRLMRDAIQVSIVDIAAQKQLDRFFQIGSAYIIRRDEGKITPSELSDRWDQQLELDRLMDDIAKGRDAESILLASRFATRPSVFVGIVAEMMKSGRETLIEFCLDMLRQHDDLARVNYNGRSLLHHAAGLACLPIVRHLLSLGINPNLLDQGGHSPLYRAASASDSDSSVTIIRELVLAGSNVNQCLGKSRSTPLHQAARFGNPRIAKLLLELGADPRAIDKNGLTPLDRAVNCRRSEVANVLSN